MNRMKKHFLWLLFFTAVVLVWFIYNESMYQNNFEITVLRQTTLPRNEPQMVLIYTSFNGRLPWPGLKNSQDFTQFKGQKCRETNCKLSYDKRDFTNSKVVIFHSYNMPSRKEMFDLQQRRPQDQIWVYFTLENPIVTSYIAPHKNRRDLDNVFNWTMNYMRDSDIYHPYGFYLPLNHSEFTPLSSSINHAKGKSKLAVWTCSGHGQIVNERKLRVLYVRQLRKHIPIDVYGKSAIYFHQPSLKETCIKDKAYATPDCRSLLQNYKFFLAFENMNCEDYITEKYWCTPLELGLVPVVMGGADYKALAIPGSYINVMDFPSIKKLVEYLLFLDQNDNEYNRYFEWKKYYKVGGCLRPKLNMSNNYPWMCEVCAAADNHSLAKKTYRKIQDFYNPDKRCAIQYSRLNEIISEAAEISLKETLDRQTPRPSKKTDALDTNMLARGQTDTGEKKGNKKNQ
ncbi:galactoside 3(4)-L-fucosyltransferase-like [Orbicella faveolata]|uniref:galactoside 3(4)-L-fucosyltransferase-like n=1 Tax=Orbicella faveolata TaxID=48498 RepID=UPI0009E5E260|nr:galactoside 3(4)-L-fucosyltransferase-like [Orbicella faveolata]